MSRSARSIENSTRQSPTRRRQVCSTPRSLRTSPPGRRSMAAAMRSRSGLDNRFSDLNAAGRISIRHDSSASELRLRVGPGNQRLLLSGSNGRLVLRGQRLIVELGGVEPSHHRVLRTSEKDRCGIDRLVREGVDELVQFCLGHSEQATNRAVEGRSLGQPPARVARPSVSGHASHSEHESDDRRDQQIRGDHRVHGEPRDRTGPCCSRLSWAQRCFDRLDRQTQALAKRFQLSVVPDVTIQTNV